MSLLSMIREQVAELPVPTMDERHSITLLPKTTEAHDAKLLAMPCMTHVETGGAQVSDTALQFPFEVGAWNLERCLFPQESADKLRAEQPSVVLLSEMDNGMARTKQKNMTAELAGYMGMTYAYGVEFIELGLGSEVEHQFCDDDFNAKGFHGNGLMAAVPLKQVFIQRLAGECLWFVNGGDQPRLGERMAIGAVIETVNGPFVAVSVHLESSTSPEYREREMATLFEAMEREFPDMPVLIGGDLNTGLQNQGDFEAEGLFALGKTYGYSRHGGALDVMTLRASLISPASQDPLKLDWFLAKGLEISKSRIVSSLDPDGRPLSDHDLILCTVAGFS